MKGTRVIYEPTGEVRKVKPGEFYMRNKVEVGGWYGRVESDCEYPIYTRREEEVDLPDPVPGWAEEAAAKLWGNVDNRKHAAKVIYDTYHAAKERGEA